MEKVYAAIDLKSFYASVECVDRGVDPLDAYLVVADIERTEKTICLAVSPALKAWGVSGRARLFEAVARVKEVNRGRLENLRKKYGPDAAFSGRTTSNAKLKADEQLELDFIVARPRMSRYMEVSARIYDIYLKFVAPEDMHVYSVDEVFIDATSYLDFYKLNPVEFVRMLVWEEQFETGITATAGIGTNMYLAKIAMDIEAKHMPADENGVRIAALDERSYREKYWCHRPLTDFWRVGPGIAGRLEKNGMFTMGDVARQSVYGEDKLYKLFGVNAELLIDHAWGWEPCTIRDIKAYRPESSSLSSGQVLHVPYPFDKARLVLREMTDLLSMDLKEKRLTTDQIVLSVGYDRENLADSDRRQSFQGTASRDYYGRTAPKGTHGSINLGGQTDSTQQILDAATTLFDQIVDHGLLVRRMYVVANHILPAAETAAPEETEQLDLFSLPEDAPEAPEVPPEVSEREQRRQEAILRIRDKFGKNAILRGMNLEDGATARDRNQQIGGHRA